MERSQVARGKIDWKWPRGREKRNVKYTTRSMLGRAWTWVWAWALLGVGMEMGVSESPCKRESKTEAWRGKYGGCGGT